MGLLNMKYGEPGIMDYPKINGFELDLEKTTWVNVVYKRINTVPKDYEEFCKVCGLDGDYFIKYDGEIEEINLKYWGTERLDNHITHSSIERAEDQLEVIRINNQNNLSSSVTELYNHYLKPYTYE